MRWYDRRMATYIAAGCAERCQWCGFTGYMVDLLWHETYDHWDRMAAIHEAP